MTKGNAIALALGMGGTALGFILGDGTDGAVTEVLGGNIEAGLIAFLMVLVASMMGGILTSMRRSKSELQLLAASIDSLAKKLDRHESRWVDLLEGTTRAVTAMEATGRQLLKTSERMSDIRPCPVRREDERG